MTTLVNPFAPAVKTEAKLRLAIAGPAGAGKTFTALRLATAIAQGGKIAVVDTEHGSASKYAGTFTFDVMNLAAPFHPDRFVAALKAAEAAGYAVAIVDSASHSWQGAGGVLELVEMASKKYKGNSYAAWGDVTPIYNRLVEAVTSAGIHVIFTMRSKQDYILVEKNGKQTPQKVGMAPVMRDGFEYEFDVFIDMDVDNNAIISKTRCPTLVGGVFSKPGEEVANVLLEWLHGEKPAETVEQHNEALFGPTHQPEAEPGPVTVAEVIAGVGYPEDEGLARLNDEWPGNPGKTLKLTTPLKPETAEAAAAWLFEQLAPVGAD